MGQTSSSTAASEGDLGQLHRQMLAHLNILKSVATVSHKEVVDCIEELNTVMRSFTDRAGKQLRFIIKRGSDSSVLWKGTIRIRCVKLNTTTNAIESSRLLTLRQFVVIYKEIIEQVAVLSHSLDNDPASTSSQKEDSVARREELTSSAFFPDPDKSEPQENTDNECCVCMERKACIMLSCCHEFCEVCIDNWTRDERHSNCPLCRTQVSGADDTWVLTDKTDPGEYASEVKGYLVGIADREGESQS